MLRRNATRGGVPGPRSSPDSLPGGALPAPGPAASPRDDAVHLGRQPVFDADLMVVGYELLFRRAGSTTAQVSDPEQATADVVVKTFADFGLEAVVGDKLAFVNLPRGFLVGTRDGGDVQGGRAVELARDHVLRVRSAIGKGAGCSRGATRAAACGEHRDHGGCGHSE